MFRAALFIYILCFGLYILFSRQPDYFDGEITIATIHFLKDSTGKKSGPFAVYSITKKSYRINAAYLFRNYTEGAVVAVIYESSRPEKGAVYSWWGYWFKWEEIVFSVVLIIGFYCVSHAVTKHPSPESLVEQLEYKPRKKRKYED